METPQHLITAMLAEFGLEPAPITGGGERKRAPSPIPRERYVRLMQGLEAVRKRSSSMAILVIIGHFLVLFVVGILAWMIRSDTKFLVVLATGTGIFALLLNSLRGFWQEIVSLDLLIAIFPDLNEEDKVKALQAFVSYSQSDKKRVSKRRTNRDESVTKTGM